MAQEIWFQRGDGTRFACTEGSAAFENMSRDGSFVRLDGEGELAEAGAAELGSLTKKDLLAYAADKGIEVNPKLGKADILAVIEEAEKAASAE